MIGAVGTTVGTNAQVNVSASQTRGFFSSTLSGVFQSHLYLISYSSISGSSCHLDIHLLILLIVKITHLK